jgi:hypothetical protein
MVSAREIFGGLVEQMDSANVSFAFHARAGGNNPPVNGPKPWSHPAAVALWGVPHRGTMGTHVDSTLRSCCRRLQLSLGSCGVVGALPRYSNPGGDFLWACTEPQTRQPFANWNTTIFIWSHTVRHPSARCRLPTSESAPRWD